MLDMRYICGNLLIVLLVFCLIFHLHLFQKKIFHLHQLVSSLIVLSSSVIPFSIMFSSYDSYCMLLVVSLYV